MLKLKVVWEFVPVGPAVEEFSFNDADSSSRARLTYAAASTDPDDATLTVAELSERVGLSKSACWRRVQLLEEQGIIGARVTLLNQDPANPAADLGRREGLSIDQDLHRSLTARMNRSVAISQL